MKRALSFSGLAIIAISAIGMLFAHEFAVFELVFLIGVLAMGFAFVVDKLDTPKINTEQVNKNIQTYNDILWGKPEKKDDDCDIIEIRVRRGK